MVRIVKRVCKHSYITLSLSLSLIREKVISTTTDFEYIETGNAKAAVKHLEPVSEKIFDAMLADNRKLIDSMSGHTDEQKKKLKTVSQWWSV